MSVSEIIRPSIPLSVPRRRPDRPTVMYWTREQYHALFEEGSFRGKRVERVFGEIVEMPAMNDPHASGITLANRALLRLFDPDHYTIRIQLPMSVVTDHDPEPDLAVVAGPAEQNLARPTTALLIVEVADTSLRYDRVVKGAIYAEAGVADYWIVNLIENSLEVYRDPVREPDGTFKYAPPLRFVRGDSVAPLARLNMTIAVASLLP